MTVANPSTFVIPWAHTTLDGTQPNETDTPTPGQIWRWSGQAWRMDGPQSLLRLSGALGLDRLHARIQARMGSAVSSPFDSMDPMLRGGFSVTDGRAAYWLSLIPSQSGTLLACHDGLPHGDTNLWVVRTDLTERPQSTEYPAPNAAMSATGLTDDTQILTADGPRAAGHLAIGDRVATRDGALAPIQWIETRKLSQARLMVMPTLRPFRHAETGLRVAPGQLTLLSGKAPLDLFNQGEVLLPARARDHGWQRDLSREPVCYVQIVLDAPAILETDGIGVASASPAEIDRSAMPYRDRMRFDRLWPAPETYAPPPRRVLSPPEAALVQAA